MSLWTPSGEHPVDRPGRTESPRQRPAAPSSGQQPDTPPSDDEQQQSDEMNRQVEEARRQMVEAPAGPVVGQQALQFYELAALHLSQPEPKLDDARLAIDALAAVVDALGARLAEAESPLRQALNQLQMAFVEVSNANGRGDDDQTGPTES